jgi:hypothetical protein
MVFRMAMWNPVIYLKFLTGFHLAGERLHKSKEWQMLTKKDERAH